MRAYRSLHSKRATSHIWIYPQLGVSKTRNAAFGVPSVAYIQLTGGGLTKVMLLMELTVVQPSGCAKRGFSDWNLGKKALT